MPVLRAEKEEAINALAVRRDNELKDEGIYLLISKNDHLNSNVLVRERFASVLPRAKRESIGHALIDGFKKRDFDGGLKQGVQAIEHALEGVSVEHRAGRRPVCMRYHFIGPPQWKRAREDIRRWERFC